MGRGQCGDGGEWQWLSSTDAGICWDVQALMWPRSLIHTGHCVAFSSSRQQGLFGPWPSDYLLEAFWPLSVQNSMGLS